MLKSLHIENMAVIRSLDYDFSNGLTVFTGETGAGKSVVTDCINFLICNRLSRELLRTGEKRGVVSAVFSELSKKTVEELSLIGFDVSDSEIAIERSVNSEGRTICRIDGKGVSQQIMRSVGSRLITIHGQYDNLRLTDEQECLRLVDEFAKIDELKSVYYSLFLSWKNVKSEIASLIKNESEITRHKDMLEFQINEIKSAKLSPGEETLLLQERTKLQSAERIKKHTDSASRVLYSNEKGVTASSLVLHAAEVLTKISDVVPELNDVSFRLRNCSYELDDISSVLQQIITDVGLCDDPSLRLDQIEDRLDVIGKLKRKYGDTVDNILEFEKNAASELDRIDSSSLILEELTNKEQTLRIALTEKSNIISQLRSEAAMKIEKEVCDTLRFLDMPKVRFCVSVTERNDFVETGKNKVDFLISANAGEPLIPISKSASGGEISRVMLALKCALAEAESTDTLIFDEVDTGISGKTSRKVGIKLKQASRSAQVLLVTHSAQIASLAHHHLLVSKTERLGRTETGLVELDDDGRIEETARILGGINISDSQRLAALDMINEGKLY